MIPLLIAGATAYFLLKNKKEDSDDSDGNVVKQNRIAALSSQVFATTKTVAVNPQTTSVFYPTPQIIRTPQTNQKDRGRRVR